MVLESQGEYDSQWAAIFSISPKTGCTPETLRVWVRQHERDTGSGDGGLTTAQVGSLTAATCHRQPAVAINRTSPLPVSQKDGPFIDRN